MSGTRLFSVYYELDCDGELSDPISMQLEEHIWRFFDIFKEELRLSVNDFQRIKYESEGTFEKIRGEDDFDKFVDKLSNCDDNEEILLILEKPKERNREETSVTIMPCTLQKRSHVGDGMHGSVQMGFHEPSSKWYVIKTIFSRKEAHAAMEREIIALQECSKSEFVVGYFGCEVSLNKKELVLEYMDRGDLRHLGILPFRVHQQVALALIKGLNHIWSSGPGYIHRDIKPDNILCNSEGYIKIADFGASKRIDNTMGVASSAAGTLLYQAPEQMLGQDYGEKVDIWAFGLTLWDLAMGLSMEDHGIDFTCGKDIIVEPIDGYPETLAVLIRNCLRQKPSKRWNSSQIETCGYLKDVKVDRDIVKEFLKDY